MLQLFEKRYLYSCERNSFELRMKRTVHVIVMLHVYYFLGRLVSRWASILRHTDAELVPSTVVCNYP